MAVAMAPGLKAATFSVTNAADTGIGTLREAILSANLTPELDVIEFRLPGSGPMTITPLTELPPIMAPVVLDGTTQPGFSGGPVAGLIGTNNIYNGLFVAAGNSTVRGLLIAGFTNGIWIESRGSNTVQGCFIGTDFSGTGGTGNVKFGVSIQNCSQNRIGGAGPGERNLISNNREVGVLIFGSSASNNVVEGNYIGTTLTGTTASGVQTNGVYIHSASGNSVGGTAPGARNLISGNRQVGVYVFGSSASGNRIQGNLIGTDVSGNLSASNGVDGVIIHDAPRNLVGGTNAGAGNVISGNGERGVVLFGFGAIDNQVQGNFIGTDLTGRLALGNSYSGVGIYAGRNNLIGGSTAEARNVISANRQSGILITADGAAFNRIEGNIIGLDVTGTNALGNLFNGVSIEDGGNNVVGGTASGARNVISGNKGYYGIYIASAGSGGNRVEGNYIGTDVTGRSARSNTLSGVRVEASANIIGGATPAARNVISANGEHGVSLAGSNATGNFVQGNYIGTDVTGTNRLGNLQAGVGINDAASNEVGVGAGNLISANGDAGIRLTGSGTMGNKIAENFIGTDVTGNHRLGNVLEGIYLERGSYNVIGGLYGNLISGNGARGIFLTTNACWNTITGNLIGTQLDGVSDLGHPLHAIDLEEGANNNTIGGVTGGGNIIAFSQWVYAGVRVRDGCVNNRILRNQIFSNGALGIDLGEQGVRPNDSCDADSGANSLQNYPVLSTAGSGGDVTMVGGTLPSYANGTFVLQFFANSTLDPSGYGEGQTFLGETTVATTNGCSASFNARLPVAVPVGYYITATATDSAGNTSEFSRGVAVMPAPTMSVTQSVPGQLTLAWPTNGYSCRLEQTSSLDESVLWTEVTGLPCVTTNGYVTVSIDATNGTRFYRLQCP